MKGKILFSDFLQRGRAELGFSFFLLVLSLCFFLPGKAEAAGWTKGYYSAADSRLYFDAQHTKPVTDCFVFDGTYTYYANTDSTAMKEQFAYHPDCPDDNHLIYFDSAGHEQFNAFCTCPNVGYRCYFDNSGYCIKRKTIWYEDAPYYCNGTGKIESSGWFLYDNGTGDYGYAAADGKLEADGFGYDGSWRIVFYHWNGTVARGWVTDAYWLYHFDETDGHYEGRLPEYSLPADAGSFENQVFDLTNQERLARGVAPLMRNTTLASVAALRAQELSQYFSHTRPNGSTCFTAYSEAGLAAGCSGENIAKDFADAGSVVRAWMNSEGHRENILDRDYKSLGVGKYGNYWVQDFYSK